jgi:hypothetical protein
MSTSVEAVHVSERSVHVQQVLDLATRFVLSRAMTVILLLLPFAISSSEDEMRLTDSAESSHQMSASLHD